MILRKVAVEGFGCFADPVEIGPFTDGINLLYAPNGTGKSTLVRAFESALVDSYRVKSAELQDWMPWGRGLTPRMVVEFEHAGSSFRLEKRFLQNAASALFRKEGGAWKKLMQNEAADDFVRNDILNCTPPGSGLAKPKNWGLAQVLWTTQGQLDLPELAGNVVESIQKSIGATLSAAGSKIEARLGTHYAEFYMPKRAALKKSAPQTGMECELERLRVARMAAEQDLEQFDSKSAEVETLRGQFASATSKHHMLAEERKGTAALAERYRELQAECTQQRERKKSRAELYAFHKKSVDEILETRRRIEEADKGIASAEAAIPALTADRDAREKACYQLKAHVESASKRRQQASAEVLLAQQSREYVQCKAQLTALSADMARLIEIDKSLAELTAQKNALNAPTAREVGNARKIASDLQGCQLRLELARVTAEIIPLADTDIRVTEAEQIGNLGLRARETKAIPGAPNVAIEIPGFGSIRVRGPLTDYTAIRKQVDQFRNALSGIEQRYGTCDLERLEQLQRQSEALVAQIASWQTQASAILRGRNLSSLETSRAQLADRIDSFEAAHPEWRTTPPDPELLETAARRASAAAETDLAEAEKRCDEAGKAFDTADKAVSNLNNKLASSRTVREHLGERLSKVTADGKTDTERKNELDQALLEHEAARVALERTETELNSFGPDPTARLALIEKELDKAGEAIRTVETRITEAQTELRICADKCPYDKLVSLKEAESLAASALERERRRMEAIKLLYNVVADTKTEMLATIAGPVEKAANENLAAICLQPVARIRIGCSFKMENVQPFAIDSGAVVPIAQLSGGEKEQLYLATRLALAGELAKSGRQLLVLDDILTFTDGDRLKRICDLLAQAAEKLQILILTCHPERFLDISSAKPFDLEAVMRSETARR